MRIFPRGFFTPRGVALYKYLFLLSSVMLVGFYIYDEYLYDILYPPEHVSGEFYMSGSKSFVSLISGVSSISSFIGPITYLVFFFSLFALLLEKVKKRKKAKTETTEEKNQSNTE